MAQLLSFTATSMDANASDVVQTISFDGPNESFALMNEDGLVFRMWWHVGTSGEDECIIGLASVRLSDDTLRIDFDLEGALGYTGPYTGVEIRYEQPLWKPDIEDLLGQLMQSQRERLQVT